MNDVRNPKSTNGLAGDGSLTDQAKTLGRDLKEKAAALSDDASRLTDDVTQKVTEQASELGSAAASAAKNLAGKASERVTATLDDQKTAGADYIGSLGEAVERAAAEFDKGAPQAAKYIRQTAGQIDSLATTLRERDLRDLVGEVESFARRQPGLFFGGAVILGFAALRFLKSSAPQASSNQNLQGGDGSSYRARENPRGYTGGPPGGTAEKASPYGAQAYSSRAG